MVTTIDAAIVFAHEHVRVFGGRAEVKPSAWRTPGAIPVVACGAYWPEAMVLTGDLSAGAVLLACYATGCAAKDADIDAEICQALILIGVHARPATATETEVLR